MTMARTILGCVLLLGCGSAADKAAHLDGEADSGADLVEVLDTSSTEVVDLVEADLLPDMSEEDILEDTSDGDLSDGTSEAELPEDTSEADLPGDTASADVLADTSDTELPLADSSEGDTPPDDTEVADVADTGDTDAADAADVYTPLCPSVWETHTVVPSPYVAVCSDVDYHTDPPTSGPHYPVWATYKTYIVPVNPGFLVHSLKHGAVVITWSCPGGCAAELTALREMLNRRAADPRCDPLIHHRIVVAPRPDQGHPLVAAAWGASWKADCFDLAGLEAFIDASYGRGLEDECFEGVDVEKIRPDDPWYCPP